MFAVHGSALGKSTFASRLFACLAVFSLIVAWLCGPAVPVNAQDKVLLYEENFDSGVAEGWNLDAWDGGEWRIDGGQLVGYGSVWAGYREPEWGAGQYTLEFDLEALSPEGSLHVNVQHSDTGRYLLGLRRVEDGGRLYVYLERNAWDSESDPLASNANQLIPYLPRVGYRVRIDFGDGQFRVYLNDQQIISAQDPQPLPPGGISFECLDDVQVRVDNVAVFGPPAALLPPVEPPDEPEEPRALIPEFPQCPGEELLYAEDFEDALAQDWRLEEGWSVGDGLLLGEDHFFASYSAENWENLTLFVVLGLREGREGLHISTRLSETGRYFVYMHPYNIGLVKQVGFGQGEEFIDLANQESKIETTEWHTLAFAVHQDILQVALDGTALFEERDNQPLPGGEIAFETLDRGFALIDSVWLCGPPSEPQEGPVAVDPEDPSSNSRMQLPDLTINAVQAEDFDSAASSQLLIVSVVNAGDAPAGPSQVRVSEQGGGFEETASLGNLEPGEERAVWVHVPIPEWLLGDSARFDIEVDPRGQVREHNEQNNHYRTAAVFFPPPQRIIQPENNWPLYGGLLLALVLGLLLARAALRRLQRGRGSEPPEQPQGLLPMLPPARLLNLWLTEGGSGQGRRIREDQPLVAGKEYSLHAQVVSYETRQKGRSRAQARLEPLPLEAVVFSPTSDFSIGNARLGMRLPREGSSAPVFWPFRANEPGLRRARVCLYYGNFLLQSAYVDAAVVDRRTRREKGRAPGQAPLQRMLDYVASASLTGLERFPQPSVSIFTNQAANGDGWIGVYAAGDPLTGFGDGLLRQVDADLLSARAGQVRQHLLEIEEAYIHAQPSHNGASTSRAISRLEQDMAVLACEGWSLYHELFLQSSAVARQDKIRFDRALRPPGLVAINRCWSEKTTLPWAAVYDLEVDTGKQDLLRLCPVFKSELESHWSEDLAQYRAHPDWLDNPQGCRHNPRCPLGGDDELLTICPFGFWGFRHQISQPLQMVQPTPVGTVPEEIGRIGGGASASRFDSTIFLQRQPDEPLKLAIGVHPGLSRANQLPGDISALCPGALEIAFGDTRDQVLDLLKQGGFHFYILYCHGDRDEREQKFKLVFGPLADERAISSENLNPMKISWPDQPMPLVLLNGCETVAVTPEMAHGLLDRMHELGAAGVVGTEIQVYPSLAYPFSLELMERLLTGSSIGEAFLAERKELLRRFTPLGLAYTYHAAAALHLHQAGACAWCAEHEVPSSESFLAQPR
jgi:hypothetical protein